MVHRLEGGDHNMISGVSAFIRTYKNMIKSSPAPSATIAYSLHMFGKADSKYHRSLLSWGMFIFKPIQEMFGVQVEGEVST